MPMQPTPANHPTIQPQPTIQPTPTITNQPIIQNAEVRNLVGTTVNGAIEAKGGREWCDMVLSMTEKMTQNTPRVSRLGGFNIIIPHLSGEVC